MVVVAAPASLGDVRVFGQQAVAQALWKEALGEEVRTGVSQGARTPAHSTRRSEERCTGELPCTILEGEFGRLL